jgi:hypothetical protein
MLRGVALTILFLFSIGLSLHAQIKATTTMGIDVHLYEDGTWKYADKNMATKPVVPKKKGINRACAFKNTIPIKEEAYPDLTLDFSYAKDNPISILSIKSNDLAKPLDISQGLKFVFTDGKVLTLNNESKFVDSSYLIYYGEGYRNIGELDYFKTKKIKSVIFKCKGMPQKEAMFSTTQSEAFYKKFNCG